MSFSRGSHLDGLPFPAPLRDGVCQCLDSFLPVASCLRGAGLWNRCYICFCRGKGVKGDNFFLGPVAVGCGGWGKGGLRVGDAAEGVGGGGGRMSQIRPFLPSIPERTLCIA